MASEFDLIARYFARTAPEGMLGVGDDCALFSVPAGQHIATSTDMLLEGRHFFSNVSPQSLGHKALAVNLSDLAAMGARPIACVLGLALARQDEAWLADFAQGFHALAQAQACPLIGGDTTRSLHDVAISVTVFGTVSATQALRRDAARIDDDIWVSGELGAADVAYRLLAGQYPADEALLAATRRALEWPEPQIALGQALRGIAHAAIDISDGLVQDLNHLLSASRLGALLDYASLPVAPALAALSAAQRLQAVLGGGDVYQLCFTAAPAHRSAVQRAALQVGARVSLIGRVRGEQGLVVQDEQGQPIQNLPHGFDHFSQRDGLLVENK